MQQELARAEALLGLLGAVRANVAGPAVVTCSDGATVVLREGRPSDADALLRCTAGARRGPFSTDIARE